jgi:hypothetical protein
MADELQGEGTYPIPTFQADAFDQLAEEDEREDSAPRNVT